LIKFLLNIPWYLSHGYAGKLLRYIKYNGVKGLKYKIKRALKSDVYNVPSSAYANDEVRELLCGNAALLLKNEFVPKHTEEVDIIICVHNAYEDVKKCVESIFEYTSEPFKIIFVDDGSGEQTRDYLKSITDKRANIKLFRNEEAKGYTYAANKGLKNSSAEYSVLLNSDTVVTDKWLDKLIKCQKSGDKVGIVGPLSNTASWQSVPRVSDENGDWAANKIPQGYTLEEYAKLIEKSSGRIYPRLPLLNGFCLLIHRSVIEKIGYFDEENFGAGFAEEDDYNLRAVKEGFALALADDTYVYHAQSKSYSNEKRIALCDENGKKLRKKHNEEIIDNNVYILKNNYVLEGIRARTSLIAEREELINKAKGKWQGKKLLFLLPITNAGGGCNVIVQEAESMIKMGVDVSFYNLASYKDSFINSYPNLSIPVLYGDKIDSFKEIAGKFDLICATMYNTVEHCNFKNTAYYIQDFEPLFYDKEEIEYKNALESYTYISGMKLVTKTEWNKTIVEKETGAKLSVIGKSADIDLYHPRKLFPNRKKPVIAAMIRPDSPRRAPEITLEILNETAEKYGDRVLILTFGSNPQESHVDRDFWNKNKKNEKIINLGKLNKQEMASVLSYADIFTDFSSFQAMGLTTMEAMASGSCVIAPQAGGSKEFVINDSNGLLIDTENKQTCIKALHRLVEDPEKVFKLSFNAIKDICGYYPEKCAYNFLEVCFN